MKVACAIRNAEIYGVADRIEFIVGDYFHIVPHLKVSINPFHPYRRGIQRVKLACEYKGLTSVCVSICIGGMYRI